MHESYEKSIDTHVTVVNAEIHLLMRLINEHRTSLSGDFSGYIIDSNPKTMNAWSFIPPKV